MLGSTRPRGSRPSTFTRGTKFTTYAVWWIRKSILSALADKSHLIKRSRRHTERLLRIKRAEAELVQALGRKPSLEEVSRHLSESLEELDRVLRHQTLAVSLDRGGDDAGESTIEEVFPDTDPTPEQRILRREARRNLRESLAGLSARHRLVIELRHGLTGDPKRTLNEIAQHMDVSRERVRQLEEDAKRKLRRLLLRQRWRPKRPSRDAGRF